MMQNPFGINLDQLQQKVKELESSMEKMSVVGTSGAGMVDITINGKNRVLNVSISDEAYSLGDKSTLEVLVAAAINDAMQKLETSKLSQAQDFGSLFGQNLWTH